MNYPMSNLTEQVYLELKRRIISGEFAPGTKMREDPISKQMQISRTPVRNALQRLVNDGLLDRKSHSIEVAGMQAWDLMEIFDIRMMLEPYAASLAAQRINDVELSLLEELNSSMDYMIGNQVEMRLNSIAEVNNKFHHLILSAARSARVIEMLKPYMDVPRISGSFHIYSESDLKNSLNHHKQLTKALRSRNPELAKEIMRFHILNAHLNFETDYKIKSLQLKTKKGP